MKKKILLIEDDHLLREDLNLFFDSQGYNVIVADEEIESLGNALNNKPDLVITDILMKELDGFDVIELIRATDVCKDVPIVILSALEDEETIIKAKQLGANEYICKPTKFEYLADKINKYF